MHFISTCEEVTPDWLTAVLQADGRLPEGRVVDVSIVKTRCLTYSEVARLRARFSAETPVSTPAGFFLKLSKPGSDMDTGQSEVEFYQKVAPATPDGPLIHCFASGYDAERERSYILMEDCSDTHSQPESPSPPSFEQSMLAVESLAKCHAQWWDHPDLGRGIGNVFDSQWLNRFIADLDRSVSNFVENLGNRLSDDQKVVYRRLLMSSEKIWGRLTVPEGLTVTQGDMHWWNCLYPQDPSRDTVRIFDWQLWHLDLGARDLAFLVALGGYADRRPEIEMPLIRAYYECLIATGVLDYSWDQLWTDYRLSAIRNLNIPVIFRTQGKHEETWTKALDRAFESYYSLECDELLQ
jgi:hypothetical protein